MVVQTALGRGHGAGGVEVLTLEVVRLRAMSFRRSVMLTAPQLVEDGFDLALKVEDARLCGCRLCFIEAVQALATHGGGALLLVLVDPGFDHLLCDLGIIPGKTHPPSPKSRGVGHAEVLTQLLGQALDRGLLLDQPKHLQKAATDINPGPARWPSAHF